VAIVYLLQLLPDLLEHIVEVADREILVLIDYFSYFREPIAILGGSLLDEELEVGSHVVIDHLASVGVFCLLQLS